MTIKHVMCPPPRPTWELVNDLNHRLHELKYLAEFAIELVQGLDNFGADDGYFHIGEAEGNRLAFCCNEILCRAEEALAKGDAS